MREFKPSLRLKDYLNWQKAREKELREQLQPAIDKASDRWYFLLISCKYPKAEAEAYAKMQELEYRPYNQSMAEMEQLPGYQEAQDNETKLTIARYWSMTNRGGPAREDVMSTGTVHRVEYDKNGDVIFEYDVEHVEQKRIR